MAAKVDPAIVEALKLGTVEVWVPKSAKRTSLMATVLPRRLSEGFARAIRADRVLTDADTMTRRNYELRASRSEPALNEGADAPQIAQASDAYAGGHRGAGLDDAA